MRALVILAARDLLQTKGPQTITLKAVAIRAGVTHGNVTYHFGTVGALHEALIAEMIEDLRSATAAAVLLLRQGEMSPRNVVDVVFDAFSAKGSGQLVAWLAATGAQCHLLPLYAVIADLVGDLAEGDLGLRAGGTDAIGLMMASIMVPALGESLIGNGLKAALGLKADALRVVAADGLDKLRQETQSPVSAGLTGVFDVQ